MKSSAHVILAGLYKIKEAFAFDWKDNWKVEKAQILQFYKEISI